jgi:hypothetical protein
MNWAELSGTLILPVMEHEKASLDPSTDATNAKFWLAPSNRQALPRRPAAAILADPMISVLGAGD